MPLLISVVTPVFAGKVKVFTGKTATFFQYKTYLWFPPRVLTKVGVIEDHPADRVLKEIVGRQLSLKGLSEVTDGGDVEIRTFVSTTSVPQLEAILVGTGYEVEVGSPH